MRRLATLGLISLLFSSTGCATYWQAKRLEEKVDRLLTNTRRETLEEVFGGQAREITAKMEQLSGEERTTLDQLVADYEKGAKNVDDVRSTMLATLGGTTRVVSSGKGIWVRTLEGKRKKVIRRDAKIEGCRPIDKAELPAKIKDSRGLAKYGWGLGQVDGEDVIFPWELTMSKFAQEIVENTARRTAQEVLRMTGDRFNRPVRIKVITETPEGVTIQHEGGEEVFVETSDEESESKEPAEKKE